ncbi:HAD family hydrolase [Caenimonas terrae]|uniref:HAD family hydrolase n=1 Tax=Caenimonas terrae TaxID=696074 RepID=A0ABW0N8F3_9BURK
MIKCVFFDYDGVLTTDRTGSVTTCGFLSKRTGIPLERIQAALVPHNRALTLGLTTYERVWPDFCATIERKLPVTLLVEAFDSTPANPAMFELAQELRTQCRLGIITDNKSDRMRRLRLRQNLDRLFDPIVISADLGCSKESVDIFEHALAVKRQEVLS